jgi:phospholipid/cholesterol/gamma-HCH transport system substrate-binding protein
LWTLVLVAFIVALMLLTAASYSGTFRSFLAVTLTSDRSGLMMEPGGKVKLRGVEVGRVASVTGGSKPVSLHLNIYPDQVKYIPANIGAQIRASTVFGAKYVDLIYPDDPSPQRIAAGAVLRSRNVSTEVNTVFQNLVLVLKQIDPPKLNAVLSALAEGVRGKGERIGEATTDANQVLLALNPRMGTVQQDLRSLSGFSNAYSAAAQNILTILDAASTTSTTITDRSSALDALLLNVIGFAHSGINLLVPNEANLVRSINVLDPTTNLLMKYNPIYTCLLVGAKLFLDKQGGYDVTGKNGRTAITDDALLFGKDPYKYPENLAFVAAKGGPGGKPGCGSLPDVTKNYPVRQLVTNTGWGTGIDIRPNPGIGHPWYADYFPVTRAVPEPPSIRGNGPPAIGPVPYPGAPPYGAPLYGPSGTPLYPGVPPPPGPEPMPVVPPPPEPPSIPGQQP